LKKSNSNKNILIVDDEDDIRNLMTEVLSFNGYNVLSARDGKEALSKIKKERVDLIILDINLPDINGYDVFKLILNNEKTKNIPVIIFSSSDTVSSINKFMVLGAKDYILKSEGMNQWLTKVKKYL